MKPMSYARYRFPPDVIRMPPGSILTLVAAIVAIKTEPVNFGFIIADPRSAINPAAVQYPFAKGLAVGTSATLKTKIAGAHFARRL
jgi:hypothetical protein